MATKKRSGAAVPALRLRHCIGWRINAGPPAENVTEAPRSGASARKC